MVLRLADHGLVLMLRVRGEAIRVEMHDVLTPGETVIIDSDEVRSASYSFLDEFVGELAARLEPSPELINVPHKISEMIVYSMHNRRLDQSSEGAR